MQAKILEVARVLPEEYDRNGVALVQAVIATDKGVVKLFFPPVKLSEDTLAREGQDTMGRIRAFHYGANCASLQCKNCAYNTNPLRYGWGENEEVLTLIGSVLDSLLEIEGE